MWSEIFCPDEFPLPLHPNIWVEMKTRGGEGDTSNKRISFFRRILFLVSPEFWEEEVNLANDRKNLLKTLSNRVVGYVVHSILVPPLWRKTPFQNKQFQTHRKHPYPPIAPMAVEMCSRQSRSRKSKGRRHRDMST